MTDTILSWTFGIVCGGMAITFITMGAILLFKDGCCK